MKILFIIATALLSISTATAGGRYVLSQEQWSRPKRVESVLQMSAINNVLASFDKSPESHLLILYPGGDEGTLWAHELMAWLVSLGVPSQQIELRPGSGEPSAIEMQVEIPLSGTIK